MSDFEKWYNRRPAERRRCHTEGCTGICEAIPEHQQVSMVNYRCPVCGKGGYLETTGDVMAYLMVRWTTEVVGR